ncbi:MAG: tRNA (adenosine(37)-N6)-dimethylallyltransferase MiaA, partial [bacterium]
LQYGISDLPAADPEVRARIEAAAEKQGWAALHRRLIKIDAKATARIHPHDSQRIQRALEVYEISGKTITEVISRPTKRPLPYRIIKLMLAPADRTFLHDRLRTRFLGMLKQGLVEEVKGLYERSDLHPSLPAMRLVGYRQVWQYLDGSLDHDTMVERAIIATRQLAKRQLTWLQSERNTKWFDCEDQALPQAALKYLNQYLT